MRREISIPSINLRQWQGQVWDYFHHGGKRAVIVAPRRHGKDVVSAAVAGWDAVRHCAGYWWAFPKFSQANEAVWNGKLRDGRPMLDVLFPSELVRERNATEMRVTLHNDSYIRLVGADSINNLVGAGPRGFIASEHALMVPWAHEYVRPMVEERDGWMLFQSTPRGKNHFWDILQHAKQEGWFWLHLNIYDLHPDTHDVSCWICKGQGKRGVEAFLERQVKEGMPDALCRQEYLCEFEAALVGSVYGDLVEQLGKRGGLKPFEAEAGQVFTAWDLGMDDSTAIWWFRIHSDGCDFLEHYESNSKPLAHYLDYVQSRPYSYACHVLPHDAHARTFLTGSSVQEAVTDYFGRGKVVVLPIQSLADGIYAARWLLQREGTRIHPRCETTNGLPALRQYHYNWDETDRVLSKKPMHDWSSHSADAFRYAAIMARMQLLTPPEEVKPKTLEIGGLHNRFTLEDLWEKVGPRRDRGRI